MDKSILRITNNRLLMFLTIGGIIALFLFAVTPIIETSRANSRSNALIDKTNKNYLLRQANERAIQWLKTIQNQMGSFGNGEILPQTVETALVLGFISNAQVNRREIESVIVSRASAYLVREQNADGSFPGKNPFVNEICVMGLSATKNSGSRKPWQEDCLPLVLFNSCLESLNTEQKGLTIVPTYLSDSFSQLIILRSDEELQAKEVKGQLREISQSILESQREEGFWEGTPQGAKEGRILATAYTVKIISLITRYLEQLEIQSRTM